MEAKGAKINRDTIRVGKGISLHSFIEGRKCLLITDQTVYSHYERSLSGFNPQFLPEGEEAKTLASVESLYSSFLDHGLDRDSVIIGFGGGAVTDTAGFAAATYLRGIDFIAVPTTLLGQADAAIGGKSGVNFKGYKNLVGSIREPIAVICDVSYLATLPDKQLRHGMAEVIKHGAILDSAYLTFAAESVDRIQARDLDVLEEIVARSIELKLSVVSKDPNESSHRRLLNFGHTLGHAIESVRGFSHGESISIGMVFAADLSVRLGLLRPDEKDILVSSLSRFGLPTAISRTDPIKLMEAIRRDKKREGDYVHMALLLRLGKGVLEPVSLNLIEEVLSDLCKRR